MAAKEPLATLAIDLDAGKIDPVHLVDDKPPPVLARLWSRRAWADHKSRYYAVTIGADMQGAIQINDGDPGQDRRRLKEEVEFLLRAPDLIPAEIMKDAVIGDAELPR